MTRSLSPTLLLTLLAAGCASSGSPGTEGFDPALADGHVQEEHVEVSPGVYLLDTVVADGSVRYIAEENASSPEEFSMEGPSGTKAVPAVDYCYKYDDDSYSDATTAGKLFGGNPSWYGSATAYSYHYDGPGPYDSDYNQVSAYLYTSSPVASDYNSSTAYIYVNGAYAGYVMNTATGLTSTYAYGTWEAACGADGTISVEAQLYHSISDYDGARPQSLYVGNTVRARAMCCPE